MEEGASLANERRPDGREVPVLTAEHRRRPLRIELDPDRDWLPRRVDLKGSHTCETRAFTRDQGHWFPSDVAMILDESGPSAGHDTRIGFQLAGLRVNHPVPTGTFGMPNLTDGVQVSDDRNWTGYFKGGFEARKRLEQARGIYAPPKNPADADSSVSDVVASAEERRFPWEIGVAAISIVALVVAWKMHRNY
jgi:hypothetical protein